MLIAKGYEVSFILVDGSKVAAPTSYAMLHDPSGSSWPERSVLIAPFSRSSRSDTSIEDALGEEYFGHAPKRGTIDLPDRALSGWVDLGQVEEISYSRRRPFGLPAQHKGSYYHPFDGTEGLRGVLSMFFEAEAPVLYRRGRLLRIELPEGVVLNERGFVWP